MPRLVTPHRVFVVAFAVILLFCAVSRHSQVVSAAFDLGIFDQALWQLSVGEKPLVSLIGRHILSDHGAFVLYPLSYLYRVWASPYLVLLLQSITLAAGILPIVALGRHHECDAKTIFVAACTYALHPVVFNVNLFDFHPEVLGVPFIPLLFLFAERRQYVRYCLLAVLIMSCKEVLALTITACGLYLLVQRRWAFGVSVIAGSLLWFVVVTQYVMPHVEGGTMGAGFLRYSYLGESLSEKAATLLLRPWIIFEHVRLWDAVLYCLALVAPCFWIFSRSTAPLLIVIAPTLVLNLLSNTDAQRSLRYQYSLPVIPIFAVMALGYLRRSDPLPKWITVRAATLWSACCFVFPLLAGNFLYPGRYPHHWISSKPVASLHEALRGIPKDASVLASGRIAPQLSQRNQIACIDGNVTNLDVAPFEYIVIDGRDVDRAIDIKLNHALRGALAEDARFERLVNSESVAVFRRK